MAYTQCCYQNGSSNIRLSVLRRGFGRQGMLESNCMIGEETSNMKGCIESKCTVNTVVSELISLLGNTDYEELNFCNKK